MSRPIEIALADVLMPLADSAREKLRDLANAPTNGTLADLLDDAAVLKTTAMREALRAGKHEEARACESYAAACEDVAALLRSELSQALDGKDEGGEEVEKTS